MCDGKSEYCEIFVKWYAPKKKYRMYCKAHGFRNQDFLTWKEVEYFKKYHPQMISKDSGPIDGEFLPEQWNVKGKLDHWFSGTRTRG